MESAVLIPQSGLGSGSDVVFTRKGIYDVHTLDYGDNSIAFDVCASLGL